ncbi:uncharacterized protein LOC133185262 [Saccostrea echinata]|uniref:uncharacterized protein LOC133185262 n=1 Tax=Saccostrea echinata TaxID=191078 RepID=UPI002A8108C6|nr:uncharacterized protein LOC133185262 [Saccostrea echinata]
MAVKPTVERRTDYLLVETCSLDDLKSPLRGSARLKYTCFDVSSRYIAVGSNTGSVYIFDKVSLRHLQVVFSEAEPSSVNNVKVCPTNKTVAFSMLNGHVQVMEMNIDKRQKPDRLRAINNHLQQSVSCIQWDAGGQKLYTADNAGNVVVSLIPTSKMKNLVLAPIEVILTLSVPVIQLDLYQDKLLVSTRTECFLCNTAKANYLQIGTKPRDGLYGGCFLHGGSTTAVIYCARPGSRLWEVHIEGNVQHTHQFKQLLAVPPTHILSLSGDAILRTENKEFPPLGTNFPVLKSYGEKFILTWNKRKLFILDPLQENPKVILWTEFQTEIYEACVQGSELYIFFVSGEMRKVTLMTVSRTVSLLVSRKLWQLAAQVCGTYSQSILANQNHKELSRNTLKNLIQSIQNGCLTEYEERVVDLLEKFSTEIASSSETEGSEYSRSRSSSGASIIRLESGIYQIKNSKSSASLDSWNESETWDEPDSGISSPAKLPSVVVSVLDVADSDKDFNFNNTFKTDQEDTVRNNESDVHLENSPNNFILHDDIVVSDLSDLEHSTFNGANISVVVNGQSDVVHSTMNKEDLNRLIHSDDIFADDEILVPRGPSKLPKRKSEPNSLSSVDCSHEKSVPKVDFVVNDDVPNRLLKEGVFDVVPLQDQDITPLIVTRSEPKGQKRTSTRRKAVTVDIDEGKKKSGKQHRRHSRNKGKEADSEVRSRGPSDTSSNLISNSAPHEQLDNIAVIQSKPSTLQRTESCPAIPEKSGLIRSSSATDLHSPSQSPLTQSWEEPQESNKRTLTSVKDSLQSKFANTKMKILKTIKEKKMMTSSPKDTKEPNLPQETLNIPEEQELKEDIPMIEPEKESSVVDLTEFIQKTVQTRSKMQDFNVLLNPGALWETLSDWMIQLNIIMKKLNTHKCLKLLQSTHSKRCKSQWLASNKEITETSVVDQDCGINDSENSQMAENGQTLVRNSSDVNTESDLHLNPSLIMNGYEKIKFNELCHIEDPFPFSEDMLVTVKHLAGKCFNSKCIHNVIDSVQPDLGALSFCDICSDCYQYNETKLSDTTSVPLSSSLSQENKGTYFDNQFSETEGITFTVPVSKETGARNLEHSHHIPCENVMINMLNTENANTRRSSTPVEFCESLERRDLIREDNEVYTVIRESDSDLSVFVRCYFFLLDKNDLIQQVYSRESTLSEDEKFEIWKAWMQSLQVKYREDSLLLLDKKSKEEAISVLGLTKHDHQKNLFYAYKLFKHFPSETVTCCMTCDNIHPMDIVYLCQLYHQKEAGYLDQFMCGRYEDLQSSRRLSNLNAEKRVIYTWLQTLLEKTKHCKQLKDEYGNPWLFNHTIAWEDEAKIDFLLQTATADQGEECLEICRKAGYWRGCLLLLKRQHKWNEMVTIVFCLGDLQLIHELELLPETVEEWKSFTELFQIYYDMHNKLHHPAGDRKQDKDLVSSERSLPEQTECDSNLQMHTENSKSLVNKTSVSESTHEQTSNVSVDSKETSQRSKSFGEEMVINCSDRCISWSDVAFLMLQYIDVSVCVGILSGIDIPEGRVNQSLYQSSITTALKHRQQRNMLHNLLEKIDSYLWARKPNTLMPELQFAISVERKSKGLKKGRSTDHLMALLSEKPPTGRRYREDSECHWGISTNVLRCCRICNVALTESISHVEPGVLMFVCGHGFHKLCCQGRVCQLCS